MDEGVDACGWVGAGGQGRKVLVVVGGCWWFFGVVGGGRYGRARMRVCVGFVDV